MQEQKVVDVPKFGQLRNFFRGVSDCRSLSRHQVAEQAIRITIGHLELIVQKGSHIPMTCSMQQQTASIQVGERVDFRGTSFFTRDFNPCKSLLIGRVANAPGCQQVAELAKSCNQFRRFSTRLRHRKGLSLAVRLYQSFDASIKCSVLSIWLSPKLLLVDVATIKVPKVQSHGDAVNSPLQMDHVSLARRATFGHPVMVHSQGSRNREESRCRGPSRRKHPM